MSAEPAVCPVLLPVLSIRLTLAPADWQLDRMKAKDLMLCTPGSRQRAAEDTAARGDAVGSTPRSHGGSKTPESGRKRASWMGRGPGTFLAAKGSQVSLGGKE